MVASDSNNELRLRNSILADRFSNYKCQMENTIGSMRREIEEMHIQAGKTKFSAGFQSHLSTGNMKKLGQFVAPDMTPEKFISIKA